MQSPHGNTDASVPEDSPRASESGAFSVAAVEPTRRREAGRLITQVEHSGSCRVTLYHMSSASNEETDGVLNETTDTVHKHEVGAAEFETECGLTHHVTPETLRRMPIEQALSSERTSKCGRCFPGAGGY